MGGLPGTTMLVNSIIKSVSMSVCLFIIVNKPQKKIRIDYIFTVMNTLLNLSITVIVNSIEIGRGRQNCFYHFMVFPVKSATLCEAWTSSLYQSALLSGS